MKHICDPKFKYRSSVDTDIRKTFARVKREEERKKKEQEEAARSHVIASVSRIRRAS